MKTRLNFAEVYKAMCKRGLDYFGNEIVWHRGVLLCGYGWDTGHIWFCDGYYEQAYKVTRKRKRLFHRTKIETWTEYENKLYMNWGWNDGANGWYSVEGNTRTQGDYCNYMQFVSGLFNYSLNQN